MPKGIPSTGQRKPGAGRKSGPLTTSITFRVPVAHKNRLKELVNNFLKEIKQTETK